MKYFSHFLILFGALSARGAIKQEKSHCFPENTLSYSSKAKSGAGLNEFTFNRVIDRIERVWSPEVQKLTGKKLIFTKDWESPRVNAHATRDDDNNPVVLVEGGLARHPEITADALMLIVCHELGHHLGGAPKSFRGNSKLRSWSSAEGQADYFAVTKCLPRIFQDGTETKALETISENKELRNAMAKCSDEQCARIALAGLSVSRMFASLKSGYPTPDLLVNDLTVVESTFMGHPSPQCRLDTFVAGANCDAGTSVLFDNNDPKIGSCFQTKESSVQVRGARPNCWFSAESN